jgi:NTE family protein
LSIGYVLSGGGAKCFAHLGAIKALEEMSIKPVTISAVSGGALFGSLYCMGFSPDEVLKLSMDYGSSRFFIPSLKKGGLFTMALIEKAFRDLLPIKKFEDLKIPLIVTTTDIINGTPVYISTGELAKPIIASSSYPGVFEPVQYQGQVLIDGGVINNFPVEPIADECDKLIGFSTGSTHSIEKITSIKQVFIRSLSIAITENDKHRMKKVNVLIEPDGLHHYGLFDTTHAQKIFEIGYQHTIEMAKEIEKTIGNPDKITQQ